MAIRRADLAVLDVDELVRRGAAAARVGEAGEARLYLAEATARDPGNADAWLWLAGVESDPQAKRRAFERVLELRADDPEARAGLERLAEKYGQAVLASEDAAAVMYCTWHPNRETGLTCTRCGRPMCPECARQHPVGWRCKECAKELRSPLYKVGPIQYLGALAAGTALSTLIGIGMYMIGGLWFFALFLGPAGGAAVAEAVSVGGGRKRGQGMQVVAAVSVVLGAAVGAWIAMASGLSALSPFRGALGPILYAVLGAVAASRRLK
ncbi:MAG: hypothetical protein ACK2T6_07730 [Anaerolineae bacterium]|jgi:hypothetical protein